MTIFLNTNASREIIKEDWNQSGYYDSAESAIEIFWTDRYPFHPLFVQLVLDNTIELACGHGRHTAQVLDSGRFTLVDVNRKNIEYCKERFSGRKNVSYLVNDGSALSPLPDGQYTALFCYDAMVHFEFEDVINYLRETFRVLSPGGKALLHFSNYAMAPGGLYHDNPHWRNFCSAPMFCHFASRIGFEILHVQTLPWGDELDLDAVALLQKPGSLQGQVITPEAAPLLRSGAMTLGPSGLDTTFTAHEMFMAFLHRAPSAEEIVYWTAQLQASTFETVLRRITATDEHLRFLRDREMMFVPAGHFYSPIVDPAFAEARWDESLPGSLPGVNVNEAGQLALLPAIAEVSARMPFPVQKAGPWRYHYENGAFMHGDAVVYNTVIETFRPKRIIEVGCGFSSALMLDVRDLVAGYDPAVWFIEPYPELLYGLLGGREAPGVTVVPQFIQDVPLETFDVLEAGDVYFMDTTHVVKTKSDVVHHFDNILPRLKKGVLIHLHDIFWPFEYPKTWVTDVKLSWNELYYFRAFMTNNPEYEIVFFNDYMCKMHRDRMDAASPLFAVNGGASIWLRKK